jgi:hypothetical protein
MTFGEALKNLLDGSKVSRAGWNGKGMWLAYVPQWSGQIGAKPIDMPADWQGYLPFVVMYTADKRLVPWLCSQTDALAIDWGIIE